MPKGFLALVLHAHLPYVRHPEHERFLEEDWFYEAITECYIPLINVFDSLTNDGVDFRLTMSLTPPLICMLTDPLLQQRYERHIKGLIQLANKETYRTRHDHKFNRLAHMYLSLFNQALSTYERYNYNLVNAFKKFQDLGKLEIITCGATHGYLPLIGLQREAVRAQIGVAVDVYRNAFGQTPKGIWLPECGYNPGDDYILDEFGIKYFFVDTHGIMNASVRPKYGVFAPLYCPSGVAAFGRDVETSKQVWSMHEGYPGDFNYREFYRDIGFDLDYDYVRPHIHEGLRTHTGMKYYKITGKTDHKEPYDPAAARYKAAEHASNFLFNRERQVQYLADIMDRQPIVVAPYDAELYGHWWFEGPQWLDFLCRKVAYDTDTIKLITPSEYLRKYPCNQVAVPSMSSWGFKGYNEVWLGGSNEWIYRHLHNCARKMVELANMFPTADGDLRRALNQAARELLLAQSSDWAFIMKTGTMVPYAEKRTKVHINRFLGLYEDIRWNKINPAWVGELEWLDNVFPNIDYRHFASKETKNQAPELETVLIS